MNKKPKPVFAKLTPQMSREEQVQNLIAVLEKSGFTIKPSEKQEEFITQLEIPVCRKKAGS